MDNEKEKSPQERQRELRARKTMLQQNIVYLVMSANLRGAVNCANELHICKVQLLSVEVELATEEQSRFLRATSNINL